MKRASLCSWLAIPFLLAGCASENATSMARHGAPAVDTSTTDLGNLHHPVSTSNPDAQKAFDQGLTLIYAFNHDEAIRSFQRALKADPNLAMAHWGIALALGPNYNIDVDADREKQAYEEIHRGLELSDKASPVEQDYIKALAKRYSGEANADLKKLAQSYNGAMRELSKKYPDDLDAATLFADSGMVLRPWRLWTHEGKPEAGTEEIVATLEGVLKANPDHVGANHLYIHAVEGSQHPERALESAARLPSLAPAAGHLVHMPSHIYTRTGDHDAAAGSNEEAVEVDRAYIARGAPPGVYTMVYYSHNMHFLAFADCCQGKFAGAKKSADELAAHVAPHVKHMAMLEGFANQPTFVLVRFRKWDDILKLPAPEDSMKLSAAIYHFARGMAHAAQGHVKDAQAERAAFVEAGNALPSDAMFGMLNKASNVLSVAEHVLDAKIAMAQNEKKTAVEHLRHAAKIEDSLVYEEPPSWYGPARESLGGVLLEQGDNTGAEKVFREDLERNPRNGRSLFGLMTALDRQGRKYEASLVDQQFKAAWRNADTQLTVDQL